MVPDISIGWSGWCMERLRPRARPRHPNFQTVLTVVAVEHAPDPAQQRTFFASFSASARRGSHDAIGHAAERQRLQPNTAGPAQRRKEKTFAAENRRFDFSDELNVVTDRRLKRDDTASVHAQRLAGTKVALMQRAPSMNERPAVALQTLHDESFPAEKARADLFVEGDADADAFGAGEKRILLRDQFAADVAQLDRN